MILSLVNYLNEQERYDEAESSLLRSIEHLKRLSVSENAKNIENDALWCRLLLQHQLAQLYCVQSQILYKKRKEMNNTPNSQSNRAYQSKWENGIQLFDEVKSKAIKYGANLPKTIEFVLSYANAYTKHASLLLQDFKEKLTTEVRNFEEFS